MLQFNIHCFNSRMDMLRCIHMDHQYLINNLNRNGYKKKRNNLDKYIKSLATEFDKLESNLIYNRQLMSLTNTEKVDTNVDLINSFPNGILSEHAIDKSNVNYVDPDIVLEIESDNDTKNVWDILDDLQPIDDNYGDCDDDNYNYNLDSILTNSESSNCPPNDKTCISCKNENALTEENGMIVCTFCGTITEELLDHSPEWRQYNNDDSRSDGVSRCGCPANPLLPSSTQGTVLVGIGNKHINRIQNWSSMIYKDRSLNIVFKNITEVCNKNSISKNIIDDACIFYKALSECKHQVGLNKGKPIIIRGDNRKSIVAACVFKACEKNKSPRSTREIASFFKIEETKITRGNKQFDKIIRNSDSKGVLVIENDPTQNDSTEDFIRRYCKILKISEKDTIFAIRIAKNCCRMKLASNHNPQSIAIGAIILMCEHESSEKKCKHIEKHQIAKMFDISEATINKIYNNLSPYDYLLVDDDAVSYMVVVLKING